MNIPNLDQDAKRVLQFIKDRGVATGREIAAQASVAPDKLLPTLQTLVSSDLVVASGNTYDPEGVYEAHFNIRPSNLSLTEFVLRSA